MRLVYEKDRKEVQIGDSVTLTDGEKVMVIGIEKPHKPESTGRVYVHNKDMRQDRYYPVVIGAKWIEREDHPWITNLMNGTEIDLTHPGRRYSQFQISRFQEIASIPGFKGFVNLGEDGWFEEPRKAGAVNAVWWIKEETHAQRIGLKKVLSPVL